MKVNIGPYPKYFGPYQLAELLCFWVKEVPDEYGFKHKPDWVHDFGEWLTYGSVLPEQQVGESRPLINSERKYTLLAKFLAWIHEKFCNRKMEIKIDKYDTWNMDSTLSPIILPMLKQLKETTHGAPYVDDNDVPDELKSTAAPPKENEWDVDENHFKRWDYILDQMIWSFETLCDDNWEQQFHTGSSDVLFEKREDGNFEMKRSDSDTSRFDLEGMKAYEEKIQFGLSMFGKYYRNLWD